LNGCSVTSVDASKILSGFRGAGMQFNELSEDQRQHLGIAQILVLNDYLKQRKVHF